MELRPMEIQEAYMTFMFPFAYSISDINHICQHIEREGFTFFTLENRELENAFYGEDVHISHLELEQFFYPFIEDKLFPEKLGDVGFFRFSKTINETGILEFVGDAFPFQIISIDITLCPFGTGIITIRTKMDASEKEISDVLNFIHYFRVLEKKLPEEQGFILTIKGENLETTNQLLFKHLIPFFKQYLVQHERISNFYGSLPFIEDERMYVTAFLISRENELISKEHLFRLGQVDGKNPEGNPFISSTNSKYIDQYVEKHTHDRWGPTTYTVTSSQAQMTITNHPYVKAKNGLSKFMSTGYYNLLIHYFYKMMLLKLSFVHSEIRWGKDKYVVDELIESITKFSTSYYFGEVVVRTEGRELSRELRENFRIQEQYLEIKTALNELYRAQEDQAVNKQNRFLLMLTVYTVVSGIYGMNLVIEEWKGSLNWFSVLNYSIFEWIAFLTALTGIGLSLILVVQYSYRWIKNRYRKSKRNKKK